MATISMPCETSAREQTASKWRWRRGHCSSFASSPPSAARTAATAIGRHLPSSSMSIAIIAPSTAAAALAAAVAASAARPPLDSFAFDFLDAA